MTIIQFPGTTAAPAPQPTQPSTEPELYYCVHDQEWSIRTPDGLLSDLVAVNDSNPTVALFGEVAYRLNYYGTVALADQSKDTPL